MRSSDWGRWPSAAEASILNAKGNSGTIMAHWFLGLANALRGEHRVGVDRLGGALGRATEEVYAGIEAPVEGTVISVMRAVRGERMPEIGEEDLARLVDHAASNHDSGMLERLEAHLRERLEVVDVYRGAPTGVVGAHAGPGAWGVFYQRVRDDDPLLTHQ